MVRALLGEAVKIKKSKITGLQRLFQMCG
jgi:hypothetical protein